MDSAAFTTYHGSCHCGVLQLELRTRRVLDTLPVRQCACSFCIRHNPRYTSDADGHVHLAAQMSPLRYRFGHGTADFIMCARCGVLAGAFWTDNDQVFGVLDLLVLDARAQFTSPCRLMDFGAETPEERASRRRMSWTPATLDIRPSKG